MRTQLLEIQPNELKFIFEAKKQSSCLVQLINHSGDYVAFKVKTTSPKKYSVRPNVGLVLPYSTSKFVVTMQAQRTAPIDVVCKDKFLVQSTIVPARTNEADINSSTFSKDVDIDKYVEEKRLSVILISPPNSPVLSPIHVAPKEADLKGQSGELKGMDYGTSEVKRQLPKEVDIMDAQKAVADESTTIIEKDSMPEKVTEKIVKESTAIDIEDSTPVKVIEKIVKESAAINEDDSKPVKVIEMIVDESTTINEDESKSAEVTEKAVEGSTECEEDQLTPLKVNERVVEEFSEINEKEMKPAKVTKFEQEKELAAVKDIKKLKLVQDMEEMKSNLIKLEVKLVKAENTISKLTEGRQINIQEIEVLKKRLAELSKSGVARVQVGFPLLYVCMVALVCIILGNFLKQSSW